jgi:hypothetical protein
MKVVSKFGVISGFARTIGEPITNEYGQIRQHLYWPNSNGSFALAWCEPLADGNYDLVVLIGTYPTLTACRNAATGKTE